MKRSPSPRNGAAAAKTPAGRPLALPTRALAELVADEWRAQRDAIRYASMPATRLAHTALDQVARDPAATVEAVVRYAASDLVCYRTDAPAALARRQADAWDPLIRWALGELGLRFEPTIGIVHSDQPPETLDRLKQLLEARSPVALAGLAFAAAVFGSAVIALALEAGRIGGERAFAAARVDEAFQEGQWGVDVEAAARTERLAADAAMLEPWFAALR